jgi:hypothetical protein
MSYIENKYRGKISEIFEELNFNEQNLIEQLNKKSVNIVNEIARICSDLNKRINLILKKFYPEIKQMDDKLDIKSSLKFYYDLIFKLTDLIRNVENFQKIDPEYYENIIEFIYDKENLISGKYKSICAQELTAFYDQKSRNSLEKILSEKLEMRSKEYFTFGSLEEEIKKVAKIAGANSVKICPASNSDLIELNSAKSTIHYDVSNEETKDEISIKVGEEIKHYLESKNYQIVVKPGILITNIKLLFDEK